MTVKSTGPTGIEPVIATATPTGNAVSVLVTNGAIPAVEGQNTGAPGGAGSSAYVPIGVRGNAPSGYGVYGHSVSNNGVMGESQNADGVVGLSHGAKNSAVAATNDAGGYGVWAKGSPAGYFSGDVHVTGTVTVDGDVVLTNSADFAEDFDVTAPLDATPGTVMVLGDDGALVPCARAYDRAVVGVVSGAGDFKPGLILDRRSSDPRRRPVALVGKVFCKVDAAHGAIAVGDLLTTSPTPGHAMKALDPSRAFGSVIGKALRPLASGAGLLPILVAMQ